MQSPKMIFFCLGGNEFNVIFKGGFLIYINSDQAASCSLDNADFRQIHGQQGRHFKLSAERLFMKSCISLMETSSSRSRRMVSRMGL